MTSIKSHLQCVLSWVKSKYRTEQPSPQISLFVQGLVKSLKHIGDTDEWKRVDVSNSMVLSHKETGCRLYYSSGSIRPYHVSIFDVHLTIAEADALSDALVWRDMEEIKVRMTPIKAHFEGQV